MTAARRRAALGVLAALLLALLAPAPSAEGSATSLRLTAVDQCAPPSGRVAPRAGEQLPAAAPLPHATTPAAVVVAAPAGGAGRDGRSAGTTYRQRGAACVRGPPSG